MVGLTRERCAHRLPTASQRATRVPGAAGCIGSTMAFAAMRGRFRMSIQDFVFGCEPARSDAASRQPPDAPPGDACLFRRVPRVGPARLAAAPAPTVCDPRGAKPAAQCAARRTASRSDAAARIWCSADCIFMTRGRTMLDERGVATAVRDRGASMPRSASRAAPSWCDVTGPPRPGTEDSKGTLLAWQSLRRSGMRNAGENDRWRKDR